MRILLVHNYYQKPGGEDQVFANETELLQAKGHQVIQYTVHNDQVQQMGQIALAKATLWNQAIYTELRGKIQKDHPDIVHFHNTFPLISPAGYYAAKAENVPVVQTLHNYRLLCSNAALLRQGHICEDCLGKIVPFPAVLHACYRNDRKSSALVASMLTIHHLLRSWSAKVDIFIALTRFARDKFIQGGLPSDKIIVKPNFVYQDPGFQIGTKHYALFIGRLSPEKGIMNLLRTWQSVKDVPLKVAGDGPLMDDVQRYVQTHKLDNVELLGYQPREVIISLLKDAQFLVFPSEWYEAFPVTIAEAFACGVPVITARIGSMAEIIEDGQTGLHFTISEPDDLVTKVKWAWQHPHELAEMGKRARRTFEERYTSERNYGELMTIYETAIANITKGKQ